LYQYRKFILILKYAYNNIIILDINERDNYGNTLLVWSIRNNIEMAKLIIEYADRNNIFININKQTDDGIYPFLISIKLLIDYANKNDIILNIDEKDITKASKMNKDIKKFLDNYINKDNIILNIGELPNR